MKTSSISLQNLFLLTMVLLLSAIALPEASAQPGWERLGVRKVKDKLDRDEIVVTRREGRFGAVKLIVRDRAVNIHRFVIHFGNGSQQKVNVRKSIPAGGATRVIDIRGPKRVIRKVVFWYDAKSLAGGKAKVELWGRH